MASSRRSRSTYKSAAKSLKRVTAGGLEGVWDTKRRCISLDLPVGVTSIQMVVEGVDGVHTMDFSSFECAGSFVQWKDYDYPWKSSDFMLAREARRHGQRPPVASSQAYPRRRDIVRFENPTRPPFLRGGQRQWRGWSYSPSELRYTPRPISRPRRSKSHSPASECRQRTPTMGTLMTRPRNHSRSPSSSVSSMRGKTQSPPLGTRIRRPLKQQYKVVLFPHLPVRLPQFAASPQRPHNPRSTTSQVTGWRNVPSFLACAMKLELWVICNPWPLPWA